jgi:hypothetical protein
MVRVGGGWAGLEEFLLKNDPCRGNEKINLFKRRLETQIICIGEHEHHFCFFGDFQAENSRKEQQRQNCLLPIDENCKKLREIFN